MGAGEILGRVEADRWTLTVSRPCILIILPGETRIVILKRLPVLP